MRRKVLHWGEQSQGTDSMQRVEWEQAYMRTGLVSFKPGKAQTPLSCKSQEQLNRSDIMGLARCLKAHLTSRAKKHRDTYYLKRDL